MTGGASKALVALQRLRDRIEGGLSYEDALPDWREVAEAIGGGVHAIGELLRALDSASSTRRLEYIIIVERSHSLLASEMNRRAVEGFSLVAYSANDDAMTVIMERSADGGYG